jgi:hypothetical protein
MHMAESDSGQTIRLKVTGGARRPYRYILFLTSRRKKYAAVTSRLKRAKIWLPGYGNYQPNLRLSRGLIYNIGKLGLKYTVTALPKIV